MDKERGDIFLSDSEQWGKYTAQKTVPIQLPITFNQPFIAIVSSYFKAANSDYTEAITELNNSTLTVVLDPGGNLNASEVWFAAIGI